MSREVLTSSAHQLSSPRAEPAPAAGSLRRARSLLPPIAATALVLCGLSLIAFFTIRDADRSSAESEALGSARVAVSRIRAEVGALRAAIGTAQVAIALALSQEASVSPGGRVQFANRTEFLRAQARVTHTLRGLTAEYPHLALIVVGPRLPADHVAQVQGWLEDMLSFPTGTLNLTTLSADGQRVQPPVADEYWPIVFQDVTTFARQIAMLDHTSIPSRAPLINYTVSTARTAATTPVDRSAFQVLYQSIFACNTSGLPQEVCVPAPFDPSRVVAFVTLVFSLDVVLSESLPTEPLTKATGVRIMGENGGVSGSWNWPAEGTPLLVDERFAVDEFQERQWTLRIVVVDDGVSGTVLAASWIILGAGLLLAIGLAAALMASSTSAARRAALEQRTEALAREAQLERKALIGFLHTTSHDMRTPLHTLSMGLIELEEEVPGVASAQALSSLRHASTLLDLIVNNVLDAKRAEEAAFELQLEECELQRDLARVVDTVAPLLRELHVRLSFRAPPRPVCVLCDRARLARCVLNVLTNAVKFTREGEIAVVLEVHHRSRALAQRSNSLLGGDRVGDTGTELREAEEEEEEEGGGVVAESAGAEQRPISAPRLHGAVLHGSRPDLVVSSVAWRHPEFAAQHGDMVVQVEVRDTGRGMSAQELERCVIPFVRTTVDNAQGSGLGLHLTLAYVLAHRGSLEIASRPGAGTTVRMEFCAQKASLATRMEAPREGSTLPAWARAASAAATATGRRTMTGATYPRRAAAGAGDGARGRGDRVVRSRSVVSEAGSASDGDSLRSVEHCMEGGILVVDDQAVNARLLQRQVQRLVDPQVAVDVAFDGEEAVAAVTRAGAAVALVFMDVDMPKVDGLEATRRIRGGALPQGQPRIIIITGNATTKDRKAALEAGADAFLAKPCSREVIASHLRVLFAHQRNPIVAEPPSAEAELRSPEGVVGGAPPQRGGRGEAQPLRAGRLPPLLRTLPPLSTDMLLPTPRIPGLGSPTSAVTSGGSDPRSGGAPSSVVE